MRMDSKNALRLEGICLKALGMPSAHNALGAIVSKDSFESHPYDALIVIFTLKRNEMTEEQRLEILDNESVLNIRLDNEPSDQDFKTFVEILEKIVG